ncbi:ABC transporter permease [Streptomyces sp. DSM 42041]|uniref:ABC transporter permease n=1 Tax=Streptomyces hazeniae TaxID=3075538 RepID=A0ABU2NRZ3_9ACTN|nr:ABC transporter permease [Streptomyces sp. DSM 42041]MDT0379753.1 ABC transporter permease [Streptomyces sp. DSM 42041]
MSDEERDAAGPQEEPDGAGAPEAPRGPGAPEEAGTQAARRGPRGWWAAFRASPLLPAVVISLIVAAAAGLFAGSYTYAMADPAPRHVPTAVVGEADQGGRRTAFVRALEQRLDSSLTLHRLPSYGAARSAMEAQEVFAIIRLSRERGVELDVAGAAGSSVAQLLREAGPKAGDAVGVTVRVRDLHPLQPGDPRGLALFYISLAAVIIGFVGAIQLGVHAKALDPAERIAFTAGYAVLGGFTIAAVVDWLLAAVRLPFAHAWLILSLTMFTSGMVFTMFQALFDRWAVLPTWGLMVILGNPSSGGAVSWPLLPSPFGTVGRWLPPGASVNAQHTAVYFPGNLHPQPYACLAAWSLVSCTVFWLHRHRHPGGRA